MQCPAWQILCNPAFVCNTNKQLLFLLYKYSEQMKYLILVWTEILTRITDWVMIGQSGHGNCLSRQLRMVLEFKEGYRNSRETCKSSK